jgi:hypothetical protein
MALAALLSLFFVYRFRKSSVQFQKDFAQAVYLDYICLETQTPHNLFTEFTAQRAFEKWLARDQAASTSLADWVAAENELKAAQTAAGQA